MTPQEIAHRYYQLFNERRFDEAGAFVHPEATFHYVPTRQRLMGRAGYRALVAAWLIAFEDARIEITSLVQLDDHTVQVDFLGHGTQTGDLVLGENFSIPATGIHAQLPFHNTLTFRNGFIVSVQFEFDADELRARLSRSAASTTFTV